MKGSARYNKYLEDYEKLKHLKVTLGIFENIDHFKFEIISLDDEKEEAIVRTVRSGVERKRTYHWIRKNLLRHKG